MTERKVGKDKMVVAQLMNARPSYAMLKFMGTVPNLPPLPLQKLSGYAPWMMLHEPRKAPLTNSHKCEQM